MNVPNQQPCDNCDSSGWVCENHPDQPFSMGSKRADACECGAGMPCPVCNPSGGLDDPPRNPPGFKVTVDRRGNRH